MQQDFHYYCIGVLARAAGFSQKDALIIAYASQYVDDSTESELIRLDIGESDLRFDPVRTSYDGLETIMSLSWSAQKRVWIPFHFLPPKPFRPERSKAFSFVTQRDSPFAWLLLDEAAGEPKQNHKRRLCRIGVALHTYADSWAHQRFSGRQNRIENDVEDISVRTNGNYEKLTFENIFLDLAPQIGHAEAGLFPDLAYQKWRYRPRKPPARKRYVERDNVAEFLQAAKTIYDWLRKASGADDPILKWEGELESNIRDLFEGPAALEPEIAAQLTLPAYRSHHAQDIRERCKRWKKVFASLFEPHPERYSYDKETWRKKALDGPTDWDSFTQRDWDQTRFRLRRNFWDSLWLHFHRAALRQRHFVLENLP